MIWNIGRPTCHVLDINIIAILCQVQKLAVHLNWLRKSQELKCVQNWWTRLQQLNVIRIWFSLNLFCFRIKMRWNHQFMQRGRISCMESEIRYLWINLRNLICKLRMRRIEMSRELSVKELLIMRHLTM